MEISCHNINAFCRTCMGELDSLGEVCDDAKKYSVHNEKYLTHWIVACTSLTVDQNDRLPEYLCQLCYDKLRSFYEFRDRSAQSWRMLTNILEAEDQLIVIDKEEDAGEVKNDIDERLVEELLLHETIKVELPEVLQDEDDALELQSQEEKKKQTDDEKDMDYEEEDDEFEDSDLESEIPNNSMFMQESTSPSSGTILEPRMVRRRYTKVPTTGPLAVLTARQKYALKFECDHCQRRYLNEENLEAHVRSAHLGLEPFKCMLCEHTSKRSYQMNTHMREVHGTTPQQYACPHEGCEKQFARKDSLKMHYNRKHADVSEEEIVCEYEGCGKVFRRAEYYRKHYREYHVIPSESKYICEDCGHTFRLRHLLRKHRCKQVSEENYPYKCEHCGKRYTSPAIYKEHLLRHSGVKKFECPHCGAKKTTRNELIKHINYHTKERQWPCPLCSKVFNSSTTLGKHDRIVHKGIKRYACRFCDQRFGKAHGRKHHEMRHTGERPYGCTLCSRRFIQVVALRAHLKTHGKIGEGQMPAPKEPTNRVKVVENLKIE